MVYVQKFLFLTVYKSVPHSITIFA